MSVDTSIRHKWLLIEKVALMFFWVKSSSRFFWRLRGLVVGQKLKKYKVIMKLTGRETRKTHHLQSQIFEHARTTPENVCVCVKKSKINTQNVQQKTISAWRTTHLVDFGKNGLSIWLSTEVKQLAELLGIFWSHMTREPCTALQILQIYREKYDRSRHLTAMQSVKFPFRI